MNTKKYTYKYNYLKLEYEDVEDLYEELSLEWSKKFGPYFAEQANKKEQAWQNTETGEVKFSEEMPEDEPSGSLDEDEIKDEEAEMLELKRKERNEALRSLYRKISAKVHPDVGGTEEDFKKLKESYDEENLIEMLNIANNYDIPVQIEEDHLEYLDKSCKLLEKKIKDMKASTIWDYFNADMNRRKMMIAHMMHNYKLQIPDEDLEDLLDISGIRKI